MFFHVTEPYSCTTIDERALQAWEEDGVLKITGLLPLEWVTRLRQRIIETLGAAPESPESWTNLEADLLKPIGREKAYVALEVEAVKNAVDTLIGKGWNYPSTGGGWFTNAPRHLEKQDAPKLAVVPRGHWHWDGRPDIHANERLWLFTPAIEMLPHSGGTWLVAGSARMVLGFYRKLPREKQGQPTKVVKKWFTEAHEWFKVLNSDEPLTQTEQEGDTIRLLNVAGQPGDVVLMKSFTIHSAPEYIGPGPRVCQVVVASSTA